MDLTPSIFEKAGIEVTQQDTVANVFKATGLDWEVIQKPIYEENIINLKAETEAHELVYNALPKHVMNKRSDNDTFLGIVDPKKYKVVQNIDAFNFIDGLDDFTFDKVGMFNEGRKIFVVGMSNEEILLDGSTDPVRFYMTFLHGHDGKSGIRFILSPTRMFCMNQMNLMLDTAQFKYNIAHTGDVQTKIAQVKNYVNQGKVYIKSLQEELNKLIQAVPVMTISQFAERLIKDEDDASARIINANQAKREAIIGLYNNKDDIQNYKGKSFGYLSAVSDYVSHLTPGRKDADINNIFVRNLEGNQLIADAYNLLKVA